MTDPKTRFQTLSLEDLKKILPEQVMAGNHNHRGNHKDKKKNSQDVATKESKGLTRVLGPASRHDSRNKYGQIPTVFAQSMSPKPGLADRMRGDACRFPKTPCCPFVAACAEKSKPV